MRLSAFLLAASLAGVLGGAWLIGVPAFGAAIIFDSLAVGVWGLMRDDGKPAPQVHQVGMGGSLHDILERARRVS